MLPRRKLAQPLDKAYAACRTFQVVRLGVNFQVK